MDTTTKTNRAYITRGLGNGTVFDQRVFGTHKNAVTYVAHVRAETCQCNSVVEGPDSIGCQHVGVHALVFTSKISRKRGVIFAGAF